MNKLYEEKYIQNIADAIRRKGGSTSYRVSEMATAISALPDMLHNSTLHVTSNGIYEAPTG